MFSLFSKASFGLLSSGSGVKSDYRDCGLKMTTELYKERRWAWWQTGGGGVREETDLSSYYHNRTRVRI